MRELDEKEGVFKSVQDKGEHLIRTNHPARSTIEVSLFCLLCIFFGDCNDLKCHIFQLLQAYKAAMQTQWSWIVQLCSCVDQHLKENAAYFEVSVTLVKSTLQLVPVSALMCPRSSMQFFSNAKDSMDFLKNLEGSIDRKYSCDQTSSLHRLEDLIQESMV